MDDSVLEHHKGYKTLWQIMCSIAGGQENLVGKKVLEIGSKHGAFVEFMRQNGIDAIGIDPYAWPHIREGVIRKRFEELNPSETGPAHYVISFGTMSPAGLEDGYFETKQKTAFFLKGLNITDKEEDEAFLNASGERRKMMDEKRRLIHKKTAEILHPGGYAIHLVDPFEQIPKVGIHPDLEVLGSGAYRHPNMLVMRKKSREHK